MQTSDAAIKSGQAGPGDKIQSHEAASAAFITLIKERERIQEELRRITEASSLSMGDISRLSKLTDEQVRHEASFMDHRSGTFAVQNAVSSFREVEQAQLRVESVGKMLQVSIQQLITCSSTAGIIRNQTTNSLNPTELVSDSPILPQNSVLTPLADLCVEVDKDVFPNIATSGYFLTTDVSTNAVDTRTSSLIQEPTVSDSQINTSPECPGSAPGVPGPPPYPVGEQLNAALQGTDPSFLEYADACQILGDALEDGQQLDQSQQQSEESNSSHRLVPKQRTMMPSSGPSQASQWPSGSSSLISDVPQPHAGYDEQSVVKDGTPRVSSLVPEAVGLGADEMGVRTGSLVPQQSLMEMQFNVQRQQQMDKAMGLMQQQQLINETMSMMKAMSPMMAMPPAPSVRPYTMPANVMYPGNSIARHHRPPNHPMDLRHLIAQQRSLPLQGHPPPPRRMSIPRALPPPQPMLPQIDSLVHQIINQHASPPNMADGSEMEPGVPPDPQASSGLLIGSGSSLPLRPKALAPLLPHISPMSPALVDASQEAFSQGLSENDNVAPAQQFLMCKLCHVMCTSETSMNEHLASVMHLSWATRLATMAAGSSTRDLRQAAGINEVLNPFDPELEVPCTEVHALCKQVVTPDLNRAVLELLVRIRDLQCGHDPNIDHAGNADGHSSSSGIGGRNASFNKDAIMPSLQKRYLFGLKEAKKAIESGSAKSVILAANIEQLDLSNESADHQMAEMLKKSKEKGIPITFALSRKRLGLVYGRYKLVSAVTILNVHGAEDLHCRVVELTMLGCDDWLKE